MFDFTGLSSDATSVAQPGGVPDATEHSSSEGAKRRTREILCRCVCLAFMLLVSVGVAISATSTPRGRDSGSTSRAVTESKL